jgi:endonuclease/exonuclease/phosphatase family metal-dependent hydrolase
VVVRIASYNLHEYVGTDGRRSPERILQVLRSLDADLVLLQEIRNSNDGDENSAVIDWFSSQLGMHAFLGATLLRQDAPYGNACLSRRRPEMWRRHDLSVPGREPRGLLELQFGDEMGKLRVLATHLGLRHHERRLQYQRVSELLNSRSAPTTVLGGDFNDLHLPRQFRRTAPPGVSMARPPSFPSRLPVLSLDRLHVWPRERLRKLAVARNQLSRVASDHLPVAAQIDISLTGDQPETNPGLSRAT